MRAATIAGALALSCALAACDGRPDDARPATAADTAAAIAAAVTPQPAPTTAVVTDSATADGVRLWLLARGDECAVRYDGPSPGELALVPKPPCHFAHRDGAPQRFAYPDVAVRATLVVLGTAASDAMLAKWNVRDGRPCGVETQGVLVGADTVRTTRAVRRGVLACRGAGVDEKEFHAFAHDG